MYSVTLDTCVLIDFLLVYHKEEKGKEINSGRLKSAQRLLRKFETASI